MAKPRQDVQQQLILDAKHHDPFSFLGLHQEAGKQVYRAFLPYAEQVWLKTAAGWDALTRVHAAGLFEWHGDGSLKRPCLLRIEANGSTVEQHDAYTFPSSLTNDELYLFGQGRLLQAHNTLGAHLTEMNGINGVRFAVWAPNAERVSVVGNFNRWDGRVNPMRAHGSSGVWDIFIPNLGA